MSWQISGPEGLSPAQRRRYWEDVHQRGYGEEVWSLTQDPKAQQKVIQEVGELPAKARILVPGCGSKGIVEPLIADSVAGVREVRGTDFPGVIEGLAAGGPPVTYEARDSTELGFTREWDAAVVVNSVLSDSHEENQAIMDSVAAALHDEGRLLGFFPTIFATLDIAYIEENPERTRAVDPWTSSFYEPLQGVWQIFYTPLRLRKLIRDAGMEVEKMEIFFCDGPESQRETEKHYGISDPDLPIYELFVRARRG